MAIDIPKKLKTILDQQNIALFIGEQELGKIGMKVTRGFMIDKSSLSEWVNKNREAMDLAMQIAKEKSYPWPRASNVIYPLLTTASLQFSARSYSVLVPGNRLVNSKVIGDDKDGKKSEQGDRIADHMSWQLLEQDADWQDDTDRMLMSLAVVGTMFRKTYFSASIGRPVSQLVFPDNLVINYNAKSMERAPRVTHIIPLYYHEVIERQRSGIYADVDLKIDEDEDDHDDHIKFLEQHCLLDLDNDGFQEPYIVTVHENSSKVVRIVPRFSEENITITKGKVSKIDPIQYFTRYLFLPPPDGGFYGVGFGTLLGPINNSINRTLNMLIDAGHLANVQGGFIGNGLRLKKGDTRIKPGEYKTINAPGGKIRDNLVPLQYPGPSPVLISLISFLVDAGKQISSVQDIFVGDTARSETATTTMARLEEGMKLFTSITKRLHRSFKKELGLLFKLNAIYLNEDEYFNILDSNAPIKVQRKDYESDNFNIVPLSDPTMGTQAQKILQAQALLPFAQDPEFDSWKIKSNYLKTIGYDDPEEWKNQQPAPQGPPPQVVEMMAKLENERISLDLKGQEDHVKGIGIIAKAVKDLADAESAESGPQLEIYKTELSELMEKMKQQYNNRPTEGQTNESTNDRTRV